MPAFIGRAENEELQRIIHAAGYSHLKLYPSNGEENYLDADGRHCLGLHEGGAYVITRCENTHCDWCHPHDEL